MCGRYVRATPPDELARYFDAALAEQLLAHPDDAPPSYNVAPTNDVLAVRSREGERRLEVVRWGLVPSWAKDPSVGNRMINARAEGIADKASYRGAIRKHRCLIPADGFYEWRKVPGQKQRQPYYFHRRDGEPLALAGLWSAWRPDDDPDAGWLITATIITTDANELMRPIHDRMPVLLAPSAWDRWLDPDETDPERVLDLLVPAPPELLVAEAVATTVNDVRNQGGAELIAPLPADGAEPSLPGVEPA